VLLNITQHVNRASVGRHDIRMEMEHRGDEKDSFKRERNGLSDNEMV
jgi:hypothetical protein